MKRLEEEGLTSNSKIAWNLITEWIREWPQIHTIFSHLSLKRQRNRDKEAEKEIHTHIQRGSPGFKWSHHKSWLRQHTYTSMYFICVYTFVKCIHIHLCTVKILVYTVNGFSSLVQIYPLHLPPPQT